MEVIQNAPTYEEFLNKDRFYTKKEFLDEYGDSYEVYANNTL